MRISHEAIYQALFVQGRGALRRELTACLRTGLSLSVPRARTRGQGKSFVTPEVMISQLGLRAAQGLVLTEGYYWDLDDISRAFGQKFHGAHRPHAEHGPCRHLLGRDAVPQGDPRRRHG